MSNSHLTLGVNIPSLNAQRRLAQSAQNQSEIMNRLSSGLRVNKASDDPAALATGSSLNTKRSVYLQGIRNLNDGLSVLNIAENSASELTGIVTRLSELANQAANGSYSPTQRRVLDDEAQALEAEFTRIAQSTSFNDRLLFSSNFGKLRLQDGYGITGGIESTLGGAIGTGSFSTANNINSGSGSTEISSADVNGDGIQDLAVANLFANTVSIMMGTGNGAFTTGTSYVTGANPRSVLLADFNGDGNVDLASADGGSNSIGVRMGDGTGSFGAVTNNATGTEPSSIAAGDFNGDDILDIVVAERLSNSISLLLGNGDGTFKARVSYASGASPDSVATADFNSDGNLDVVSVDTSSNVISVYLGTGSGTLSTRVSYANSAASYNVEVGDLNNDGAIDIVTAGQTNDEVSIFMGQGDGTFAGRISVTAGDAPSYIALGDFNGDGSLDIASADSGSDTVSILLNQGSGSFGPRTTHAVGDYPDAIHTDDFNGDGVPDLVTANGLGNNISVLVSSTTSGIQPLLPFSLSRQSEARKALKLFDDKLESLTNQSGVIGAFRSRVDIAIRNSHTVTENLKAAESRIMDADIALETAELARTSILRDAAAAVLAQSHLNTEAVLRLLQ